MRLAVLLTCAGCAVDPGDGRAFLVIRGDVDPRVEVRDDDPAFYAAWITLVDRELCFEPHVLDLVPQVTGYEVVVEGPPSGADGDPCEPAPPEIGAGPAAWAVLALIDRDPGVVAPELSADPERLLAWMANDTDQVADLLWVDGGRLAAYVAGHILAVRRGQGPFDPAYCRFDGLIGGLVLYEDRGPTAVGGSPSRPPERRTRSKGSTSSLPA